MNHPRDAILPVSLITSFGVFSTSGIFSVSLIYTVLAFIPLFETRKPRNLPKTDPEGTLFSVEFYVLFLKDFKGSFKWTDGGSNRFY